MRMGFGGYRGFMQLPPDVMKNTAAFLALVAGALACAGLALTLLSYAAFFFFVQGIDSTVSPQLDTAVSAISNTQSTLASAADSAGSASGAISNGTLALYSYADATDGISSTLSSIAQNPLISLDPQIGTSAAQLRNASVFLREAAQSLNRTSGSAGSAAASLKKVSLDAADAKKSVSAAKEGFKAALGTLTIAGFLATLCFLALFSSVGLLSVSMLLSHYPDLLSKKDGNKAEQAQPEKK